MPSVALPAVSAPPNNPTPSQASGPGAGSAGSSRDTKVFNNLNGRDPDLLFEGETVKLPNGQTVVVEAGETLSSIAAAHGTTVDQLIKANGMDGSLRGRNGPNGAWFTPGGPTPQPGGSVALPPNGGSVAPPPNGGNNQGSTTTQGSTAANNSGPATNGASGLPTPDQAAGMLRGMKPGATVRNPPPADFLGSHAGQLRGLLTLVRDGKALSPEQQQQLGALLARWTPTNVPPRQ
jgi:hypothetical protein